MFDDDRASSPSRPLLVAVAAVLGALAAAGVGAVIDGVTGASITAAGGAAASVAHMVMLMRYASSRTPAVFS